MPAQLIVNADDFGLTPGINRAVAELHDAGAVRSATLMAVGAAFDDAVAVARTRPGLGVGCHVVLLDGTPVSHPADIPTLLGPDGKTFRTSLADFALAVVRGHVREDDIAREALAQIQRLQRAGIDVTHVDTHKHTHMLPTVARTLLWLTERTGVAAIRNPFEPAWAAAAAPGGWLRSCVVRALRPLEHGFKAQPAVRSNTIQTSDGSLGVSATGALNRASLDALLAAMPSEGTWELVCHPGHNDVALDRIQTRLRAAREIELHALLDVFGADRGAAPAANDENTPQPPRPALIHYGELGATQTLRAQASYRPPTGFEHVL